MAAPPIQLLDYVVERFLFEVNPAYRLHSDQPSPDADSLSLNLEVHWEAPEPSENFQSHDAPQDLDPDEASLDVDPQDDAPDTEVLPIDLVIQINEDKAPDDRPFRLVLRLSGLFARISEAEMKNQGRGDNYLLHTLATGISMLYGAARQVVASTTSQSPYDKVLLPAISPLQIADRVLNSPSADDPANVE